MSKNKISLSAWVVVVCHSALSRSERWGGIVPQENLPFYRQCLEYCRARFHICRLLGLLPDSVKLWLVERSLAHGAPQHYALRKQAIAKQVLSSIANGSGQLVVLGGGFDLLAFNTARSHPHMACFEVDTPQMHAHKMHLLNACYGALPANFHASGIDLHDTPLHGAITLFPGFNPVLPTLFVAEGLTMYLCEDDVKTLFTDLRKICTGPVSVIFTAIEGSDKESPGFWDRFRNLFLNSNNEKFAWCVSRKKMTSFLLDGGFAQQYQIGYADLQRPLRSEREMDVLQQQSGEYLVCAIANLQK